jgi:membrane-associated HD superfamily phosphohydrolase
MYIVSNNEVALTRKQTLFDKEKLNQILSQQIKDAIIVTQLLGEIKPNIVYDEILSNEMAVEEPEVNYIYKSKIEKGDVLLRKNDIVTEEQTQILKSYHLALSEQEIETTQLSIIVGQFLACILVLGIMMLFLAFFRKSIFSQNTQVTFIFLIILLIIIITSIVAKYNVNYIYAVPFCLVPILIRVFFDSRTSLFNFLNIILICAFFTPDKF